MVTVPMTAFVVALVKVIRGPDSVVPCLSLMV